MSKRSSTLIRPTELTNVCRSKGPLDRPAFKFQKSPDRTYMPLPKVENNAK